jgi:hypothetical protein
VSFSCNFKAYQSIISTKKSITISNCIVSKLLYVSSYINSILNESSSASRKKNHFHPFKIEKIIIFRPTIEFITEEKRQIKNTQLCQQYIEEMSPIFRVTFLPPTRFPSFFCSVQFNVHFSVGLQNK